MFPSGFTTVLLKLGVEAPVRFYFAGIFLNFRVTGAGEIFYEINGVPGHHAAG